MSGEGWRCLGCGLGVDEAMRNTSAKCINCGRSRDYSEGAEYERARVVAWLAGCTRETNPLHTAEKIQRGEHRKGAKS